MATLRELYEYYCRRWDCKPNSGVSAFLDAEYARHGNQRLLYEIDVSKNFLGKNGVYPVLDLVKNSKTVTTLDISNNRLEHEQLEHLVYCLILHPCIQKILLRNNCLHDGSFDHILKLLESNHAIVEIDLSGNYFLPASLELVSKMLERNRDIQVKLAAERVALEAHRMGLANRPSYQAQMHGKITPECAGGYIHFSTWRKNLQYRLCLSRTSRVSLVLQVTDTVPMQMVGFVVMRHDGARRVIELSPDTIMAESSIDYTDCTAEVLLEATGLYVVMPYAFHPGRTMSYTLQATLINDVPSFEEGWITLDAIEEQYDWCKQVVSATWPSRGGRSSLHTWRYNNMYHICCTRASTYWKDISSLETVHLLLTKDIDPSNNDEKEIGLDVVAPSDSTSTNCPPLCCTSEVLRWHAPHERKTSIFLSITLSASELNFYVVPSTRESNQEGSYTLSVFSSALVTCTPSVFPHNWNYRMLEGEWDAVCCGGCRDWNQCWKSNPSVKVDLATYSVAASKGGAAPTTALIACLELVEGGECEAMPRADVVADATPEKLVGSTDWLTEAEGAPAPARGTKELTSFIQSHNRRPLQVCLAAVDTVAPHFADRGTASASAPEACLSLTDQDASSFYLVAMTRFSGQVAKFRLHLFAPRPFILDELEALDKRERKDELAQYESESRKRKADLEKARVEDGGGLLLANTVAERQRGELLAACLAKGQPFIDRDFPKGASSLWLYPDGEPPYDFPREFTWKRASSMAEHVACLRNGCLSQPFPFGKRHWFASILQALAAKRHWLARIFVGYDKEVGYAQFRFSKWSEWVHVLVDDYLAVDATGALCFGHSMDALDVFYPLAEKAYAKLHRCYEALEPKVTPELSLQDLFVQGLTDVSGGYCEVRHLGCGAVSPLLSSEAKDDLWRKLKHTVNDRVLYALLLDSTFVKAPERAHVGILPDHLYPILDARFVEKRRLVKVRNWCFGASTAWRGKWAPHSPAWTETLLQILDYSHGDDEVWMTFDEMLFYFSDLLQVERHAHVCSLVGELATPMLKDAVADANGVDEDTDVRLRFPQFALQVSHVPAGCSVVEVIIGVHQQDARLSVTRARNAVAQYKSALGLAIFDTEDNRRFLKKAKDEEVIALRAPARARDLCLKVTLDPATMAQHHLTLVPFWEQDKSPPPYYLTARSSYARVSIIPVPYNTMESIKGRWSETTAGGPPGCHTWRDNPQYLLYPSETMEMIFYLTLDPAMPNDTCSTQSLAVGLTVHQTRQCCSFLHFQPETVVLHVSAEAQPCAMGTVTLVGVPERRGMPYVVVPHCSQPGVTGGFTLKVCCNRKAPLVVMDPRLDWHRCVRSVYMNVTEGNTGGAPRFPSWRCNPQLLLNFPIEQEGRLLIAATNRNAEDTHSKIGLLLLYGDPAHDGGCRYRLNFSSEDVVARSEEAVGCVEIDVSLNLHVRAGPLFLVVYHAMPYRELEVDLSFYSQPQLEVSEAAEWKYTALVEGCWKLGQTAGGTRRHFASWINNPFIALSLLQPTTLVAVLVQYPRGREPPIVKRYGNRKAFLPPPLTNPDRRTAVELDLVRYDEDLTPLASTGPSNQAEVVLVQKLDPYGDRPYIFVPATSLMEEDIEFKLLVYADHPINLYPLAKPRLPYVENKGDNPM